MKRFIQHIELFPIVGVLVFLGGHWLAAIIYPGGHQWDYNSIGYNLFLNFWCDLIWPETYNGDSNPASGIGIFTTIFLTLSIAVFFIEFARYVPMTKLFRLSIMIDGVIAMIFASLIFTDLHSYMIYLAAFFALMALIPMMIVLVKNNYHKLAIWGGATILALFWCIFQLASKFHYYTLPFIQKIAFIIGLSWVIALCLKIRNLKI